MWCNLLNFTVVLSSTLCLTAFVHLDQQDRSSWHEVDWVQHLAETEYGIEDGSDSLEIRLFNGKRIDLIWSDYAIEVDWANKFPEGIGQSLYYAAVTHRKPAVLLLVKNPIKDQKYIEQALVVCRSNEPRIRLWAYDTTQSKFMRVSDAP